jgi:predicted nucleic acid-binding protein
VITAVDTNVLIDILEPDPDFGPASRDLLKQCRMEGVIVACGVVWAETFTIYGREIVKVNRAMDRISLEFDPLTRDTATEAARRWFAYREKRRRRDRIAADFLIGAHAFVQCDRLLTRDRGFYGEFFRGLTVLDPTENP